MSKEKKESKVNAYVLKDGSVIQRDILERYALKVSAAEGTKQIRELENLGLYGLVPHPVSFHTLVELLTANTFHYRAVKTKANDAVGIGWRLEPKDDKKKPNEAEKAELEAFLNNPHPEKTLDEILSQWVFDLQTTGNGYLELIKDNERTGVTSDGTKTRGIHAMDHIPSHTMYRHEDLKRYAQQVAGKVSWFVASGSDKDVNNITGELFPLGSLPDDERGTEVIHILNYSPSSDYYGLPDIMPALRAIFGDLKREEYNTAFFENYAVPAYAVTITGMDLTPELQAQIQQYFQRDLKDNPHSTLVISAVSDPEDPNAQPIDIKFEKLAVDEKEASFVVYRKDNKDEVLAAHGVPPYRLGIAEEGSLGGSTSVEATEVYKQSILNPIQSMIEARINRHILEGCFGVVDWVFKFDEIDTRDEEKDIRMDTALFAIGAITINEIRQAKGWDKINHPLADMPFVANQPLDQIMKMMSQPEQQAQDNQDPKQQEEEKKITSDNQLLSEVKSLHNQLVNIAVKGGK